METLIDLHTRRWQGAGVLRDEGVRAHHREAAPLLAEAGMLRMYTFEFDGEVKGVYYGLAAKGRAYYYLGGYDPALAKFSPGTLLVGHAIEQAMEEDLAEFDFLRGQEAYKYRWGAEDTFTYRFRHGC